MARRRTNAELWASISGVGVIRDKASGHLNTTLSAAITAGVTVIPVTAGTNSANGDIIRIGNEDNYEVGVIESGGGTTSLTLVSPTAYAHAAAEPVVEQEKVLLGDTTDQGIGVEIQAERNQVNAATKRAALAHLIGQVNARLSFGVLNHSLENLLTAVGASDTLLGAGTAADPFIADWDFDDFDTVSFYSMYFTGALKSGEVVEIQAWRASFDPNKAIQYARGAADGAPIPYAVDVKHVRYIMPAA